MARVADAPVLVSGRVIGVDDVPDYETGALKFRDVSVLGAKNGVAVVRFPIGEYPQTGISQLDNFAVLASPSAWSREGGSANVRYKFVQPVTAEVLDEIAALVA